MEYESWSWHWGNFVVYCIACFFLALVTGLLGFPGIIILAAGAVVGLWAALARWFEVPIIPRLDHRA